MLAGAGLGIIVSGFVVPRLAGWQAGWLLFAVISGITAVVAYAVIRNRPEEIGAEPYGKAMQGAPDAAHAVNPQSRGLLVAHLGVNGAARARGQPVGGQGSYAHGIGGRLHVHAASQP